MDAETTTLRDGDIYRWSYREPGDDGAWGRYHCCSNIAIVRSGWLHDTYWMIGDSFSSHGRKFGLDDLHKLHLTFVANFADLNKAHERDEDYYDDDDIVNINHANSTKGNFYLRKGAKRSAAKMLEAARYKLERAESEQRMAADRAERLRSAITSIEAGDTSAHL